MDRWISALIIIYNRRTGGAQRKLAEVEVGFDLKMALQLIIDGQKQEKKVTKITVIRTLIHLKSRWTRQ